LIQGFDKGYLDGYEDGKTDGKFDQWVLDIKTLKEHAPENFKDDSYKLGYYQAIEMLKEYGK